MADVDDMIATWVGSGRHGILQPETIRLTSFKSIVAWKPGEQIWAPETYEFTVVRRKIVVGGLDLRTEDVRCGDEIIERRSWRIMR